MLRNEYRSVREAFAESDFGINGFPRHSQPEESDQLMQTTITLRNAYSPRTTVIQAEKSLIYLDASRIVSHRIKLSNIEVLGNMILVTMGVGVLSVPYGFSQAGAIGATFALVLASLISLYMVQFLSKATLLAIMYTLSTNFPCTAMEDLFYIGFGKIGSYGVGILNSLTLIGVVAIYRLITGNMVGAFASLECTDKMCQLLQNKIFWQLVFFVLAIPICFISNHRVLQRISECGVVATLSIIFISLVGLAHEAFGRTEPYTIEYEKVGVVDSSKFGFTWLNIGQFVPIFNIYILSFFLNFIMPLQVIQMATPSSVTKLASINQCFASVLYSLVGILGYYLYGDSLTLLDEETIDKTFIRVARGNLRTAMQVYGCLMGIAISLKGFFSGPMIVNSLAVIMQDVFRKFLDSRTLWAFIMHTFVTIISLVIPHFFTLLKLVSALCMVGIQVWLPPMILYVMAKLTKTEITLKEYVIGTLCFFIGIFCTLYGLWEACNDISKKFSGEHKPHEEIENMLNILR